MLCSCSVTGFNSTDIMRPPKPTGKRADVSNAIESVAGSDYTLKYPQNGEYRSAIILEDIDSDSEDEALALISKNNQDVAGISLLFIDNIGGKYQTISEFDIAAAEVDRVCIMDMNDDKIPEILIGWGVYSSHVKTLSAYSYTGITANELVCEENYSEMYVADLNSDKKDEIILFSLANNEKSASAKLLKIGDSASAVYSASTVLMNSDVARYTSILFGKISNNRVGFVLDGITLGSSLQTQIIYLNDSGMLENPLFSTENSEINNLTTRTSTVLSADINNDEIIEIPTEKRLNDYFSDSDMVMCDAYDWNSLDEASNQLTPVTTSIHDGRNSYKFILPASWKDNVTAEYSSNNKEMVIYKIDFNSNELSEEDVILRIKTFNSSEQNIYNNFEKISEYDGVVYAYKSYLNENDELYITDKQIKNSLLINKS